MIAFNHNFPQGVLCNVILQNLVLSVLSKRFDVKAKYDFLSKSHSNRDTHIRQPLEKNFILYEGGRILEGIPKLYSDFSGENNVCELIDMDSIDSPILIESFLQKECVLYGKIKEQLLDTIIKNRIEYPNQVSVHVRLGDQEKNNPGFGYYQKVLSSIKFDGGIVFSDSPNHHIVKKIVNDYGLTLIENDDFQEVISLASKYEYRVVTGGSSGWMIGVLGDNDNVFYMNHNFYWQSDLFNKSPWTGV